MQRAAPQCGAAACRTRRALARPARLLSRNMPTWARTRERCASATCAPSPAGLAPSPRLPLPAFACLWCPSPSPEPWPRNSCPSASLARALSLTHAHMDGWMGMWGNGLGSYRLLRREANEGHAIRAQDLCCQVSLACGCCAGLCLACPRLACLAFACLAVVILRHLASSCGILPAPCCPACACSPGRCRSSTRADRDADAHTRAERGAPANGCEHARVLMCCHARGGGGRSTRC